MSWSATQYLAFENERTRPVRDLLAAVPTTDVRNAVDIGCGPGNSTEMLIARYPGARVSALDSSADMLASARKRLPEVQFDQRTIEAWDDAGPFDVILANAVLQWLPDHDQLFPRLMAKLTEGGSLAVQMPDNLDEPAHVLMREIALAGPWSGKLAGVVSRRAPRREPSWYFTALRGACRTLDIWRTTYHHALPVARAPSSNGSRAAACVLSSTRWTSASAPITSRATVPRSHRPTPRRTTASSCCRFRGCSSW
jgi:trans-aconitate 2-methyltransferase